MTATGHAIVGTLIAAKIGNPALAIPLALASHVACDLFPHWDAGTHSKKKTAPRLFLEAAADVIVSFILVSLLITFLFPTTPLFYAFLCAFAAQFLDWITVPYTILKQKYPPFSWIYRFQSATNITLDKPWGIINQITILVLLTILVKIF